MDPMISSNTGSVPAIPKPTLNNRDMMDKEINQLVSQGGTNAADNRQNLKDSVEQLQKAIDAIQGPPRTLEFSIHEKTNAIMIKVMNKETGDLIREVPPEKILDLAARMMEITGIIVDKKV